MNKPESFSDKIHALRKSKNLTMEVLAAKIGVSKGTISLWESGKIIPPKTTISLINKLFGGEQEEIAGTTETDFILIPQVRGTIAAGGGLVPDDTVELRVAFRREWIQRKGDPNKMSLIRVIGDSMEPTLTSGDLVLVDHNRNYVDPQGGIYAIAIEGEIAVKRIQMLFPTKKLRIISDNSRYEPIEIEPGHVVVNGKVVWFCREIER